MDSGIQEIVLVSLFHLQMHSGVETPDPSLHGWVVGP